MREFTKTKKELVYNVSKRRSCCSLTKGPTLETFDFALSILGGTPTSLSFRFVLSKRYLRTSTLRLT